MPILEQEIEQRVVRWAKQHGFLCPKVKFAERGYPDRLFVSPSGHTVWIEFKRPGGTPDPLQVYRLRELATRKQIAVWCDNANDAISILRECLDPEVISGTGDTTPIVASVRGAISGSGSGQDQHLPSSHKDPEGDGPNYESPDRSAPAPHVQGVAGRNTEVEGLQSPNVLNFARSGKGPKSTE